MKLLAKIILVVLKILFCLVFTLFCLGCLITVSTKNGSDGQINFYIWLSLLLPIFTWLIFFMKTGKIVKIVYLIILIIYFSSANFLPSVKYQFDEDFCLDSAICSEGLELNTEYGKIKINKENCLKYGWGWNETKKQCDLKK